MAKDNIIWIILEVGILILFGITQLNSASLNQPASVQVLYYNNGVQVHPQTGLGI